MVVKSTHEFRMAVLKQLSFTAFEQDNCILYQNELKPELGHFRLYHRPGYYDFGIADYTIPHNFKLTFDNPSEIIRFGIVHQGITNFRLENQNVSSFTPSTFFVFEKGLRGDQIWRQGQHYHGAEITIYKEYLTEILFPIFPNWINLSDILYNHTYRHLSLEIVSILQQLQSLSTFGSLTPIYLESKIMECMAALANEVRTPENAFTNQLYYGEITIGKNRKIRLTSADMYAIQKAHDILEEEYSNPPTIENLSTRVLLNPQKLKAGFSYYYHVSIGEYSNSLRMTVAVNLLSTTNLSIEEIAYKVGYHHASNFVNRFKKTYGKTPLSFRRNSKYDG